MVGTLADSSGPSLRAWADSLERAALIYHDGLHIHIAVIQFMRIVLILGFPVGDGAAEKLLKTD